MLNAQLKKLQLNALILRVQDVNEEHRQGKGMTCSRLSAFNIWQGCAHHFDAQSSLNKQWCLCSRLRRRAHTRALSPSFPPSREHIREHISTSPSTARKHARALSLPPPFTNTSVKTGGIVKCSQLRLQLLHWRRRRNRQPAAGNEPPPMDRRHLPRRLSLCTSGLFMFPSIDTDFLEPVQGGRGY